jgi:hypothetical protein
LNLSVSSTGCSCGKQADELFLGNTSLHEEIEKTDEFPVETAS